ncbi:hypothetical protein EGR_00977 [Echinococcus granulosus]|uniref:Uncharacterized protein n=1 Tax=Echinococcus granulosus TaxID=6210 RepID=W6UT33_ECHGR|nr:hypothetical protein EGR_00977 [Echinococcus granulosus]EUB64433.1 hypothetical protein EGR_00977 [Echinococcus granulosus]
MDIMNVLSLSAKIFVDSGAGETMHLPYCIKYRFFLLTLCICFNLFTLLICSDSFIVYEVVMLENFLINILTLCPYLSRVSQAAQGQRGGKNTNQNRQPCKRLRQTLKVCLVVDVDLSTIICLHLTKKVHPDMKVICAAIARAWHQCDRVPLLVVKFYIDKGAANPPKFGACGMCIAQLDKDDKFVRAIPAHFHLVQLKKAKCCLWSDE